MRARARRLADLAAGRMDGAEAVGRGAKGLSPEDQGRRRPTRSTITRTSSRPLRELFEAFRKEVPALDPCVSEEFLKHYKRYVAYKAETNFVDVKPRPGPLRSDTEHGPFPRSTIPRGLCGMSRQSATGATGRQVGLSSLDELALCDGAGAAVLRAADGLRQRTRDGSDRGNEMEMKAGSVSHPIVHN